MPEAISSLPSATAPIRHASETEGAPDTHEISFNELWQNKKAGMSFSDVLDIVNPLQHIPGVSTVYRMITGDEISMGARMVGGALYGGPLGIMGAGVVAAVEEATGKKIEGHIASIFTDTPERAEQLANTSNPVFEEEDDTNSPGILKTSAETNSADQLAAAMLNPVTTLAASPLATILPNTNLSGPQKLGSAHLATARQTTSTQLSQMGERKILQFLSDRKEATGQASANAASGKKRLSDAILDAQRAQTGLLLSNLGPAAGGTKSSKGINGTEGSAKTGPAPVTPFFKPHPYMLPRGAPPALVAKAMEHALERYNTLNAQKAGRASATENVTGR
jgi:hypothetical protein